MERLTIGFRTSLITCTLVAGVATLWAASYSKSFWLPTSLRTCHVQLHSWRGRLFLVWDFRNLENQVPYRPYFVETNIYDQQTDGPPHPNPIQDEAIHAAERTPGYFTARQLSFGVPNPVWRNAFGFNLQNPNSPGERSFGITVVPFWILIAIELFPICWKYRRIRKRSALASRGICPTCGYDLRATPRRCPECGTQL